jgi:hypothetical protein
MSAVPDEDEVDREPEPFDIGETYPLQDDVAAEAWSHPDDEAYDEYDARRESP